MFDEFKRRMSFERDFTDTLRWCGFDSLADGQGMNPKIFASFGAQAEKWDYKLLGWIDKAERGEGMKRGKDYKQYGSRAAAEHVMRVFYLYRQKTGDNARHLEFARAVSDACNHCLCQPDDFWAEKAEEYRAGIKAYFAQQDGK